MSKLSAGNTERRSSPAALRVRGRRQVEIVQDGIKDLGQGVHRDEVHLPPRPVETHGGQRTGPHIEHLNRIPIRGRRGSHQFLQMGGNANSGSIR